MTTPGLPDAPPACGIRRLVMGAASLTLAVTLLRLFLELLKAPEWLASRQAGGGFAVLGISWLPIVFGPMFAARIGPQTTTTWAFLKRMYQTLLAYGWACRVPVVLITLLGLYAGWDIHFTKFGPGIDKLGTPAKIGVMLGAQLVFWSMIWTPLSGTVAGLVFHKLGRKSAAGPADAAAGPMRAA